MRRSLLTLAALAAAGVAAVAGTKVTYTTQITRSADKTADAPTRFQVNLDKLCEAFGRSDADALNKGLETGTIKLLARQGSTDKTYSTVSYGMGYWFTAKGVATSATNAGRRIACKFDDNYFKIIHLNDKCAAGDEFSFAEMFVQGSDTVQYAFHVTLGAADAIVSTDQPKSEQPMKHRADRIDAWKVKPQVRLNEQSPMAQNYIQLQAGETFTLDCIVPEGATAARFTWKRENPSKTLQTLKLTSGWTVENATADDAGCYILSGRYTADGKTTTFSDYRYYVDVQTAEPGAFWDWTGELPTLSYNFRDEYPTLAKPEKVHTFKKKNGQPANQYAGEWWSAFWGDDLNPEVGGKEKAMEAAENMVKKYDDDFAYIRDEMGWPPDLSARKGYKSFVYIFGSGLANDNTPNTEPGGYQGFTNADGQGWACVWASYLPFSRFRSDADKKWSDGEYQREAMIHEGIHAIFADLNACQGSSWFHEGGNTWLQGAMNAKRYGTHGKAGFLDGGPFLAPFMPIECYSGWLQDGSFGGPAAQGVNMYNDKGQVCTWRTYLGGVQYANAFPVVLAAVCGDGSIPWIWRYCKNRVLETIGKEIGDAAMRSLITQYRARQALFDLNGFDRSYRDVADDYFGTTIQAEWEPSWIKCAPHRLSPYQTMTKNSADGWLAPDTLTNPGWSGANIIPIHIDGNVAQVEFRPEDSEMRALLCYRTKDGKCHYSQPVRCGTMTIDLTQKPANDVIFAVVCNTDYVYTGDAQRKKHWDYRLRLGEGALAVADNMQRWYRHEQKVTDPTYDKLAALEEKEFQTGIRDIAPSPAPEAGTVRLLSTRIAPGATLRFDLAGHKPGSLSVHIVGASGVVADADAMSPDGTYTLPSSLRPGMYFICVGGKGVKQTFKAIVK